MSEGTGSEGAGDVRPASRRFEIITAICAIFISAVSLVVAIDNERVQRQLVAASTWPFVDAQRSNSYGATRDSMIGIANEGVGPAKIKYVELLYRGRPMGSPGELLRTCCGLGSDAASVRRQLPKGAGYSLADEVVLRPGDSIAMLIVQRTSDPQLFERFRQVLLSISFRGCYCSALDECWMSDLDTTATRRVAECPKPEDPYRFDAFV